MSGAIAFVLIMVVATLAFEAAWRIAVALLVFGPAAYAAIIAGWVATTHGVSVPLAVLLAIAFGAFVRVVWIRVIAVSVSTVVSLGATLGRRPRTL